MSAIDQLVDLFAGPGAADYLGEPVTQAQHMLQAGQLAERAGASDDLIAAALLHDVGHFQGAVTGADLMKGTDNRHSVTGADWLAQWFSPAVCEPIRLHVDAKRYLCAVEPDYAAGLSAASVFTLGVQGGPMTHDQARRFEADPYHLDAIALRRWDDQAKDPGHHAPGLVHYRARLERLVRP